MRRWPWSRRRGEQCNTDAGVVSLAWLEQNHAADEPLRAPQTPGIFTLVADEQGRRFVPQRPAQPQERGQSGAARSGP